MTEVEQEILQTLLELERSAAAMPSANPKPNLLPLFTRLDDLAKVLPASADPQLRHYLQRRSYQKARVFLQGGVVPND
jgi:hypothetical protein